VRNLLGAALLAAVTIGAAPAAHAQLFGQYAGGATVPMNGHLFGAYLNASENVVGLSAQLRLSFYPNIDFGFQGGLSRVNYPHHADRTVLRMATDLKCAVVHASETSPFDMAVGGAIGVESGDGYQVIALGPTVVVSRDYGGEAGGVTPFVGAGLMFSNIDVGPTNTSDMSIPLRGGAEWRAMPDVRITGELQLRLSDDFNDDLGLSVGVHMPF
jgi:hypothetical protein